MISEYSFKKMSRQLMVLGFSSYKEFLESKLWKEFKNQLGKKYDLKIGVCDFGD